jgi:hypothetical protein
MKKTATAVNQPCKTDTTSETPLQHVSHKMHRNHKFLDHSHGRVNKTPIGINFAPGLF